MTAVAVGWSKATVRAAGRGCLGAGTLVAALVLGAGAEAQGTMAEERCKALMKIVTGVTLEYQGQISADFIGDLQSKVGENGKCDGPDQYRLWPNTKDREALGRIRQMLTVWDICHKEPSREGCKE
jgi:hypothetical protein